MASHNLPAGLGPGGRFWMSHSPTDVPHGTTPNKVMIGHTVAECLIVYKAHPRPYL